MKFSFVGEQHKLSTGQTGTSTDVIFSLGSIFADCNGEGAKTAHPLHLSPEECGFREQMGGNGDASGNSVFNPSAACSQPFDKPVLSRARTFDPFKLRIGRTEKKDSTFLRKTEVRNP